MAKPNTEATWKLVLSEPAIHGVVLVAGLVEILAATTPASLDLLIKVLATLVVFWAAHVYAGTVAHLDDEYETETHGRVRFLRAVRLSIDHSWGLLLAGVIPLLVLTLGVFGFITDRDAIWGTMWTAVGVLGILGWLSVASWTTRTPLRLLGALSTSLLGLALVLLKALIK